MKIQAKRDEIQNIEYGSVVYKLDQFGRPLKDDPLLVLNTETSTGEEPDFTFVASLNDGNVGTLDDSTIVEIADVTLTINQY